MGNEWKEYRLGEITQWLSGGTPSKKVESYWNGNIPWISASSMVGNRYSDSKLKITHAGLENGSRLVPKDTILLLVRGSILHQKIPVGISTTEVSFNQDVKALIPDLDVIEPWYLLFWFMANEKKILGMVENTGIGAGKLDTKLMQNLLIKVPPYTIRKKILAFAKALDDKISLNRRMNETLEQMAQALFKSWFVDFDPVLDKALAVGHPIPEPLQAKAARRRELGERRKPLPDEIAALFPDAFVFDEEMGWVPEGWEVCSLKGIIQVKHGYAFKGEFFSSTPSTEILLTPGNFRIGGGFKGDKFKYYNGEIFKDYILKKDDLLITMTDLSKHGDTLGFPLLVPDKNDLRFHHNQRLGKVEILDNRIGKLLLYQYFLTPRYRNQILSTASGTTVRHSSPSKILEHRIFLSNGSIEKIFESMIEPTSKKVQANEQMNDVLSLLRDTLPPKLISGELPVEAATEIVQDA